MTNDRKLRVFLCHAKEDKPAVRELYRQLTAEGWMDVWLDEVKLLPGQEWDTEIEKAVEQADVVIVCLSNYSVDKEGYVQKELRFILNIADEKPEGTIFVIPLCLDDCTVPRRLRAWQWVDYYIPEERARAFGRLIASLKLRSEKLGIFSGISTAKNSSPSMFHRGTSSSVRVSAEKKQKLFSLVFSARSRLVIGVFLVLIIAGLVINYLDKKFPIVAPAVSSTIQIPSVVPTASTFTPEAPIVISSPTLGIDSTMISPQDGMVMVYVPAGTFDMGSDSGEPGEKPVHTVYLDAFWIDQTEVTNAMYDKCVLSGKCGLPDSIRSSTRENYYGSLAYKNFPAVNINWFDAVQYCEWAGRRLPTEAEWEKAASWDDITRRKYIYPWGYSINCTLANFLSKEDGCVGDTVEVGSYQNGKSPYGALDMAGNALEWVNDWYNENYYSISPESNPSGPDSGQTRVFRGGSFDLDWWGGRVTWRGHYDPNLSWNNDGFRCARSAE